MWSVPGGCASGGLRKLMLATPSRFQILLGRLYMAENMKVGHNRWGKETLDDFSFPDLRYAICLAFVER